jgi:hypothetical protein
MAITLDGSTGITTPSTTSTTTKTDSYLDASGGNTATINGISLRPGVLDAENRIINGAFDFWQRGTSTTTPNAFIADRWVNGVSGGTATMSQQSFTLGDTLGTNNPTYFLRQTVSGQTLSSSYGLAQHRIEDVRSYAGQTFTILGWARRSSGTGNMAVEISQDFGGGGSPSSIVLLPPQTVTLTTSFAPFALTFTVPSIAGKTLGTDGKNFLTVNFWTSAGSDYNARSNSLGLQTIGVDLWGIHTKLGTHTTDAVSLYKQPELEPELARCQRYCVVYGGGAVYERFGFGLNASSTLAFPIVTFPVQMRIAPALSVSNIANTGVWNGVTIPAASAASIDSASTKTASVSVTVASGLTTSAASGWIAGNSLAPRVIFDAEL